MADTDSSPSRRTRGRPPAIRLDDVVEAAAAIPPAELTISRVAEGLGVTRAAVYHYVENVEQLRRLAARAAMVELAFDDTDAASWQEWLRGWAHAMRRWRLANGAAGPGLYLTAEVLVSESVLGAIEHGVRVLMDAGFPGEEAGRAVQFMVGIVWINTQDEILAMHSDGGIHPQAAELAESGLLPSDEGEFVEQMEPFADPDRRFEHDLELALEGLSARLHRLTAAVGESGDVSP